MVTGWLPLQEDKIIGEKVAFRPMRASGIRLQCERFSHKGNLRWVGFL